MVICNIYVIRNDVNGKVYVGQTRLSIEERFNKHLADSLVKSKYTRPLYKAMNKYGRDKFHIESIDTCSMDEADEREQYWIKRYKANASGGYNATIGGKFFEPYDYDAISDLLARGFSTKEICAKIGCCKQTVFRVARLSGVEIPQSKHDKPVKQYSQSGVLLNVFRSTNAAAKFMKSFLDRKTCEETIRKNISRCCNQCNRSKAYGFIWCHADPDLLSIPDARKILADLSVSAIPQRE